MTTDPRGSAATICTCGGEASKRWPGQHAASCPHYDSTRDDRMRADLAATKEAEQRRCAMTDAPATRLIHAADLVGASEMARRLHYSPSMIYHLTTYRDRGDQRTYPFPEPVAVVGKTKVWNWPDVVAWANWTRGRSARRTVNGGLE